MKSMTYGIDITAAIYGTGVSRYTTNLVSALTKVVGKDEQLLAFGANSGQFTALKAIAALTPTVQSKLYRIPGRAANFLFNQSNLPIELFTGPLDVFHAWDWYLPRTRKAKLVTTVHDLYLLKHPETAHPEIKKMHEQSLKRAKDQKTAIIAVSEATKKDLMELVGIDPAFITVIPEALPKESEVEPSLQDVEATKNKFKLNKPYFLIVGTNEPRKNIPNMVKAWHKYRGDFDLVLTGKSGWGNVPDEPGLIKTGYVRREELAALYRKASLLLYVSLYEGFGLPILEGFYHQIPVLTANNSSLPEVAGEAAMYAEAESISSIEIGIAEALSKKASLIEAGNKRLQQFSWQHTAEATVAVYRRLSGH